MNDWASPTLVTIQLILPIILMIVVIIVIIIIIIINYKSDPALVGETGSEERRVNSPILPRARRRGDSRTDMAGSRLLLLLLLLLRRRRRLLLLLLLLLLRRLLGVRAEDVHVVPRGAHVAHEPVDVTLLLLPGTAAASIILD